MYIQEGLPSELPGKYNPYLSCKQELTTEGDCVMWGSHVVIPLKPRSCTVDELHQNHAGVARMKALARNYLSLKKCLRGWRSMAFGPEEPSVRS